MKKIILFAAVLFAFQHWGSVTNDFDTPSKKAAIYASAVNARVVLYATSWCGYCKKTRELLEANNVEYYEYDIEKSAEGRAQHKELGGRGVPLLIVKDVVVKGYNRGVTLALIKKL